VIVETSTSTYAWRLGPQGLGPLEYVPRQNTLNIYTTDCTLLASEVLSLY
jgi:hypothetical protein